mmetsp:Transcript_44464/g.108498  ORF Transcript_44464/g.108498 Transcript_44464/m.108498 type:complete len:222 (-) Transcript_44464:117-782(-)
MILTCFSSALVISSTPPIRSTLGFSSRCTLCTRSALKTLNSSTVSAIFPRAPSITAVLPTTDCSCSVDFSRFVCTWCISRSVWGAWCRTLVTSSCNSISSVLKKVTVEASVSASLASFLSCSKSILSSFVVSSWILTFFSTWSTLAVSFSTSVTLFSIPPITSLSASCCFSSVVILCTALSSWVCTAATLRCRSSISDMRFLTSSSSFFWVSISLVCICSM